MTLVEPAGGVLHAHRHRNAGRHQTVFLVLHRAGTHGDIGQQVDQVLIVRGVEHLIGGEEAGLLDHAQVHAADGLDTLEQVVAGLRVGIVQQALVAGALVRGLLV